MGATSADTQREIGEIRKDVASALEELDARARRMIDVGSHTSAAQGGPATIATVAVVGLAVSGFVAYKLVSGYRHRHKSSERPAVLEAAQGIGDELGRAQDAFPAGVRISSRGDSDGRERSGELQGSDASMLKKVLWAVLAASMMALGGLVARRISAAVWKAAMNEDPPSAKV